MTDWHVAQYERGGSTLALARLEQDGFTAYLPRLYESLTRSAPMFMGYLFVEESDNWRAVSRVDGLKRGGVMCMAGSTDLPYRIPEHFIARCRAEEAESEGKAPPAPFRPGDRVCLSTDEYGANTWTVQGLDAKGRVLFLMEFMGKQHEQAVSAKLLRKVG